MQKHGEPTKEALANEIRQALAALAKIAVYYNIENELNDSINRTLTQMQNEGLLD